MFITEEELAARLRNPRNLANRFRNGREISREISREIISYESETKIPEAEAAEQPSEEEGLYKEGIQFREIKRPGNNRPWLSKSERTGIAADFAASSYNIDQNGLEVRKTQTEIARQYGVTVSTVSDIVNNKRRVEDSSRAQDQVKVDAALDKVREAAVDRLMAGLGQLTTDKISAHNAKDISAVCANVASVIAKTNPQEKATQQINLVVYTPELRAEKSFDSVEI